MNKIQKAYASAPKTWIWQLLAAFIVACLLAWSASAVRVSNPTGNGLEVAKNILSGIFHPLPQAAVTLGHQWRSLPATGNLLHRVSRHHRRRCHLAAAFLSLRQQSGPPAHCAHRPHDHCRHPHRSRLCLWAYVYPRHRSRPFAGLLTMSLCSIGMVSKMFIESIEDLDKRILESLDAAGCTTFQKIRYGILPQLTADFTSTIIYRFDMNLRDATVLGLVGAGGIGAPLIFAMSSYRWNEVGAILLGLIILVLIIEAISAKIRVRLARG